MLRGVINALQHRYLLVCFVWSVIDESFVNETRVCVNCFKPNLFDESINRLNNIITYFSERSLLVVAAPRRYVDDLLKVPIGNTVTLKNKYAEYYWVEFEGNEGWIQVGCVKFVTHDEGMINLGG